MALASLKGKLQRRRYDLQRRRIYKSASHLPIRDAVLFESFQGKVVGDSPLEIAYQVHATHPELELLWTVDTLDKKLPSFVKPVVFGSDEWLTALATSKYLVNNAVFPWYFSKRSGQTYLQTWHGTPLKRIVNDVTSGAASRGYKLTVTREAQMWDFLVSPSAFCDEHFATAFNFHGTLLRGGYPRNDRLVTHTSAERTEIRERLGIGDTVAVLYAPTWRPNLRNADGSWRNVDLMDVTLPEGFTLLYRGHTNTSAAQATSHRLDVTKYPDVNDLLIAADVLITDYSSIMFDFSVMNKPIILLTPDIDDYAQDPGFYFDLQKSAPGPLCNSAQEVLLKLANLTATQQEFTERYRLWQEKFVSEDDGKATQRVVDRVFR